MTNGHSDRDLKVAEEIGGLKAVVEDMAKQHDASFTEMKDMMREEAKHRRVMHEKVVTHDALLTDHVKKIETYGDTLKKHSGMLKWIMGIGTGIMSLAGLVMGFLKVRGG